MKNIIKIRQAVKKGYIEMESGQVCDTSYPTSKVRRGRVQGEYGNISPTVTCETGICRIYKEEKETEDMGVHYSIRKLLPEECFVLMGLDYDDVKKCRAVGLSDAELYKQAGNGIVTNCIELIAERLYQNQECPKLVTTDMQYNNLKKKNKE
jgi:DNA (cytosine-5)-methyltransferase 1